MKGEGTERANTWGGEGQVGENVSPRGLNSMTPLLLSRLAPPHATTVSCHHCLPSPLSLVSLPPGRSTLSRCCNAPSFLFTTQKNTPLGTKLKYEVDTSGIYHINQEIFRMFPKVPLWAER